MPNFERETVKVVMEQGEKSYIVTKGAKPDTYYFRNGYVTQTPIDGYTLKEVKENESRCQFIQASNVSALRW